MCVVSPCIFTSCAGFLRARRAHLERIQIYSNFSRIKIGKIFALSKFWRQSHQTSTLWTKLHRLTHTSITNLSRSKKKKKTSRELLCKNGSFFPEDLLCFGWRLRYSCWLRYLQRKANLLLKPYVLHIAASVTVPRVRATDIWIKAELKFVSLERKRVRWMRKILPLHAVLDQRTTEFIFTMQLYPNISCTTWHLDGWKKIIACFGKIWKPPKQVSGYFEVWQKSRDSTLIVDRVFS